MTKLASALIYFCLAALLAGGLLLGVNRSIDAQTDVLREIRNSTRAEVCVLAIAPDDRTPELVSACLKAYGL